MWSQFFVSCISMLLKIAFLSVTFATVFAGERFQSQVNPIIVCFQAGFDWIRLTAKLSFVSYISVDWIDVADKGSFFKIGLRAILTFDRPDITMESFGAELFILGYPKESIWAQLFNPTIQLEIIRTKVFINFSFFFLTQLFCSAKVERVFVVRLQLLT